MGFNGIGAMDDSLNWLSDCFIVVGPSLLVQNWNEKRRIIPMKKSKIVVADDNVGIAKYEFKDDCIFILFKH